MGTVVRAALGLALVASLAAPAGAQGERCTADALSIDGVALSARFCVPAGAGAPSVGVTETFTSAGKSFSHAVSLAIVAGAQVSRTIDDVDLAPLGLRRSLHMTLAFHGGGVMLEHALALPGAIPIK